MNPDSGNSWLVLVPTPLELEHLLRCPELAAADPSWIRFELCGFGLVSAGILATRSLNRWSPRKVVLAGIAGSLRPDQLKAGEACWFSGVCLAGIGIGSGSAHIPAGALPWEMFPGGINGVADVNQIGLLVPDTASLVQASLLSVATASADRSEAGARMDGYPTAVAEDMEGYAVAAACALAGVPLAICRGISNEAGCRNHAEWSVDQALAAVAAELVRCLVPVLSSSPTEVFP